MEKITEILESIDFSKLVPDLGTFLGNIQLIAKICVMIGPLILLGLGMIYLLIPPDEANHKAGFRTYFGMGSVQAWHFTQRLAGIVLSSLGLILSIVMWAISRGFPEKEISQLIDTAALCLIWQGGLVLLSYLGISVTAMVMFDRKGDRRRNKKSK